MHITICFQSIHYTTVLATVYPRLHFSQLQYFATLLICLCPLQLVQLCLNSVPHLDRGNRVTQLLDWYPILLYQLFLEVCHLQMLPDVEVAYFELLILFIQV